MTATRNLKTRTTRNGREQTQISQARVSVIDSGDERNWHMRLAIGTPTRGMVHYQWYAAMRNIVIPANWGNGWFPAPVDEFGPMRFTVAHAQNVIVREFMNSPIKYEWLLLLEDDILAPPDLFIRLDEHLRDGPPIVSGLYYQKGFPPDPLIYRGRGNGAYRDWKPGDKVWCDGVPTGCLLIHRSILEILWNESREYTYASQRLREVFLDPRMARLNENGMIELGTGTSDLNFCRRVILDDVLKRAGWPKIARKKWPFLVDTAMLCGHIAPDGTIYGPNP